MTVAVSQEADDRHDVEPNPTGGGPDRPGPTWLVWRWLPCAVTVAGIVAILLWRHTPVLEICRYGLYIVWGLTLPGTLLYRALRRTPHSLVDDLAMGTALGFALELAAWAVFSALGWRQLLWVWPALVVLPFILVRRLRRHWARPTGYRSPPLLWSWILAAIALTLILYLGVTFMLYEPTPSRSRWYYLDFPYLMSLVGEAKHHLPLHTPQAALEPLHYHWFAYAHMASASMISGVDTPVVFFRLALPMICVVSIVLTAIVGWRVANNPWVGAVAAALMYVIGEFSSVDYHFFGLIARWIVWTSPSASYAWISTFPLILIVVELIRRHGLRDAISIGRGQWALLVIFAMLASASKSTVLPVVIGGLGIAGLVELIRRRRVPMTIVVIGAILSAVQIAAAAVVYAFESYGLRWEPFQFFDVYIPPSPSRSAAKELALFGIQGGAYVIYIFARLAGIPVLGWLVWRRDPDSRWPDSRWSVGEWYLLGGLVVAMGGTLLLGNPGWSQSHILRTGWAFGVILSAMGLVALVRRHRASATSVAATFGLAVAVAFVVNWILTAAGANRTVAGWRMFLPIYWAGLAATLICCLALVVAFVVRWTRLPTRGQGVIWALAVVLATGVPVFVNEIRWNLTTGRPDGTFYAERIAPEHVATADWLRANVSPDDLLATNAHCPPPAKEPGCLHLTFWLTAYAERRVLVGGWGYVPRSVAEAARHRWFAGQPQFWDQEMLARNDAAFYQPAAGGLALLRDTYGVGWLVVDREVGVESELLRSLATLRFEQGNLAVYELS